MQRPGAPRSFDLRRRGVVITPLRGQIQRGIRSSLFRRLIVLPAGLAQHAHGRARGLRAQPDAARLYREDAPCPWCCGRGNSRPTPRTWSTPRPRGRAVAALRRDPRPSRGRHWRLDGIVYAHIHSAGCARDIPGATLTTLQGVGHSPHHSAPESVVAAILEVDRRAAEAQTAPPSGPTTAMRRMLVAPGVPKGTPATTISRSPTPTKPSI